MATLGDMTTYISARLIDPNNTSVSSSSVIQAVNDAIRYWKYRRFWFNEEVTEDLLTTQDSTIPLPADFLVPSKQDGSFEIVYSNYRYILSKTGAVSFDAWYLNNGYGLPRWYAKLANDEYHCYPIPDRAYTIRRYYLKDYTDLSADGDTNDFTVYAERLIELWALSNLQAELRQDLKMSDYYAGKAQDEYRQLTVMTNKANASGRLSLASALQNVYWN